MRSKAALGLLALGLGVLAQEGFPYPEGFRFWTHVKSMEIQQGHPLYEAFGGLHHIYANPQALVGYLSGKRAFPEGSVIVFDLLEAKEEGQTLVEGRRKLIGVMVKDSQRHRETGGWGYYAFGPDKKPLAIDPKACHACHQGAASTDFVFSTFRP